MLKRRNEEVMTEFEVWTEKRPYLKDVSKFYEKIAEVVSSQNNDFKGSFSDENWQDLLKNKTYLINHIKNDVINNASKIFEAIVNSLKDSDELPSEITAACKEIDKLANKDENFYATFIKDVLNATDEKETSLDDTVFNTAYLLCWQSIAYLIKPSIKDIAEKADEKGYVESHCPMCGKEPSIAVLKRGTKGRRRRLVCGHCRTEWFYKRIGCPYCGNEDQNSLRILQSENEPNIRADVCNKCKSYILTNLAESDVSKQEWAWLHMDILCSKESLSKKGSLLVAK